MSSSDSDRSRSGPARDIGSSGDRSRTKFVVCGQEMVHKQVTSSGGSGRVYLPMSWLGKHVKIVRLD